MPSVSATPIVPICPHTQPSGRASATPLLNITDFTTSAVGSMVITACAPVTASAADGATTAPASASGLVAAADPSQTVVSSPAATRLRAIAEPMMPVPSTVTSGPAAAGFIAVIERLLSQSGSVYLSTKF